MNPLSHHSAAPAPYRQLAGQLREKIRSGLLAPGDRVPSIPELSRTMKVSRQTAHRALAVLGEEGLTTTKVGRGTFVRKPRPRMDRYVTERYEWEKQRVRIADDAERGQTGNSEYDTGLSFDDFEFSVELEQVTASQDIANTMKLEPGAKLLQRRFRTILCESGLLTGSSISHVPYELFAQNPALLDPESEPWPGGTQHQLYTVGVEVAHIEDVVTARPATEHDVATLELVSGSAVLDIRKITTSTTGQVVEVADITVPAYNVRLRYTTHLTRWEN